VSAARPSRPTFSQRYRVDANGERVLVGLTIEETFEFETLDDIAPLDDTGDHVAWSRDGKPTNRSEKRWLELCLKRDEAWKKLGTRVDPVTLLKIFPPITTNQAYCRSHNSTP
jgi:hypothetical protein